MTDPRLERAIADTLSDLAPLHTTDYIDDVLARTARTRQRPTWTFPGRYLDMPPIQLIAIPALAISVGLGVMLAATVTDTGPPAALPCPTPSASPARSMSSETAASPTVEDCEPWIAYQWFSGEEVSEPLTIKAVRPDGSDAHVVVAAGADAVMHPDWSHDGSRLAFDRWRGEIIDIWTADADGSDAGPLVGCELPCLQLSNPAWSPDDTKLVVARWDRPEGDPSLERCYLEVIEVASLQRTVILEGTPAADGTWRCFGVPRWSSDGSRIVLTLDDWRLEGTEWVGAGRAIATVDASGSADQDPQVLTDPAMQATHPDWHPTEDLIVFGTHDLADFQDVWLATNLYTVRADGSELTQVTDYGDGDVRATFPTWTPDGQQIVFTYVMPITRDDRGGRSMAFINPDGTGLRVVPGINGHEPRLRPIP
jgi:Tol biopolymer transport system component